MVPPTHTHTLGAPPHLPLQQSANLSHYSGYTPQELRPVLMELFAYLGKERKFQSIFRKYSVKQVYRCSRYAEDWIQQTNAGAFQRILLQSVANNSKNGSNNNTTDAEKSNQW